MFLLGWGLGFDELLKSKIELKKLYKLLNLSDKQIAVIEAKAKFEKLSSKKLVRKWVLEHV